MNSWQFHVFEDLDCNKHEQELFDIKASMTFSLLFDHKHQILMYCISTLCFTALTLRLVKIMSLTLL